MLLAIRSKIKVLSSLVFFEAFFLGLQVPIFLLSSHDSLFNFFFFCLFRAAPPAYGSSQARGGIRDAAASLHHSHRDARSEPHLRPTPLAHGNAESLTHWARPGIEPTSSWILARFVTAGAMTETALPRLMIIKILCFAWLYINAIPLYVASWKNFFSLKIIFVRSSHCGAVG